MNSILIIMTFQLLCHCNLAQPRRRDIKNNPTNEKVWTFAFSNDGFPADYIDADGKLVGQSVDMVREVCKLAEKQCKLLTVRRKDCWNDKVAPGYSKDERIYDVCANLVKSPAREEGYIFGEQPIFNIPDPVLIVRPDSTITVAELKRCNNYKLAYARLLAVSRDCVKDGGFYVKKKRTTSVVASTTITEAMDRITDRVLQGKADVGLVLPRFMQSPNKVRYLTEVKCSRTYNGLNMMTHKQNSAFLSWWNPALKKFLCSQQETYSTFCRKQTNIYGVDAMCRKPGNDTDCSDYGLPYFSRSVTYPDPASTC